jgi:hypothetical protein
MRVRVRSDASELIYTPADRLTVNPAADTVSFRVRAYASDLIYTPAVRLKVN